MMCKSISSNVLCASTKDMNIYTRLFVTIKESMYVGGCPLKGVYKAVIKILN